MDKIQDNQNNPNNNDELKNLSHFDEDTPVNDDTLAVKDTEAKPSFFNKHNRFIKAVIAVSMVFLLLTGVLVTMLLIDIMGRPEGDPIATFYLSTGDKLEFVVFEEKAPLAATNFMFLAKKGFFNNTLFHDNQNNWLRFMGMEDYSTYRGSNDQYCRDFTGFDVYDYTWAQNQTPVSNIFNYRIKGDTTSINFSSYSNTEGLLVFMHNNSSTLFQISCIDNPSTVINSTPRSTFTVLGKYANQKTLETLQRLNLGETYRDNSTKNGPWFNPNTEIRINQIKISNYDKSVWDGKKGIMNNLNSYIIGLNGYYSHASNYINSIT